MYPFCHGLPSSIWRVFTFWSPSNLLSCFSMNSEPLSLRIYSAVPYFPINQAMTLWTFRALMRRSTWIHRHSRVYSSITVSIRSLPPLIVLSWMKSHVQTWLRWVAVVGNPVEKPRRLRFGFLGGILNPSSLRRYCILRVPTCHPLPSRRWVIFGYPNSGFSLDNLRTAVFSRANQASGCLASYWKVLRCNPKCLHAICSLHLPYLTKLSAIWCL